MAYTIHFTPAAQRQFDRLDSPTQRRVARAIDGLSENPRHAGVRKLAQQENLWRIRVGNYRAIYEIRDRQLVVVIVTIGHRSDVYR